MKFHSVHGCNIIIDCGGSRATRVASYCNGIVFSSKPLSVGTKLSILLEASEQWNGALHLGVTTHDPATLTAERLPCYSCPDLTSKQGFWVRPLPEKWAAGGTRLTFYVNAVGQFHLFVNNEHKGAILVGLPIKEHMWVLFDLYGITVSAKFVSAGSPPVEVLARGPEAVFAYHNAVSHGSVPYFHTRIMLIGPPCAGKTALKNVLVKDSISETGKDCGIDTRFVCKSSPGITGELWSSVESQTVSQSALSQRQEEPKADEEFGTTLDTEDFHNNVRSNTYVSDEYYEAVALNIVQELLRQKKKEQIGECRSAQKLKSLHCGPLKLVSSSATTIAKQHGDSCSENGNLISTQNMDIPSELPEQVVELVEAMMKETENKIAWERRETEKGFTDDASIIFNLWDFKGDPRYLILHQLFLSPQTIYLLVFDLSQELDAHVWTSGDRESLEFSGSTALTTIQIIQMWLEAIHVCTSYPASSEILQLGSFEHDHSIHPFSPSVIFVGTKKDKVTDQQQVELVFNQIKSTFQDKAYFHHISSKHFAISSVTSDDSSVVALRQHVEELAFELCHIGVEVPLKWMSFEYSLHRLLERNVYFADVNKLSEVARLESISSEEEFRSMVHFFHHKGKIWHLGSDILDCNGIVILKPQWFIDCIYRLLDFDMKSKLEECNLNSEPDQNLMNDHNIMKKGLMFLTKGFFEKVWPDLFHHASVLLGLLNFADVICEVPDTKASHNQRNNLQKLYFLPWTADLLLANDSSLCEKLDFILEFSMDLPVGFLTRLLARLCRYSVYFGIQNSDVIHSQRNITVDHDHEVTVNKISPRRIKITLTRRAATQEQHDSISFSALSPQICAKVRCLIEKESEFLQDNWYKRISSNLCVPCPCDKACESHGFSHCMQNECLHLLPLSKCLSRKVVECDYRLVKTDFVRKYFCSPDEHESYNTEFSDEYSLSIPSDEKALWEDSMPCPEKPSWLNEVANMLTFKNTGHDWKALAKILGYDERDVRKFHDDIYPSLSLINNWLESNGQTRYCIDVLTACLEQIGRHDVVNKIWANQVSEVSSSPVFISYQSDSLTLVLNLRRRLELAGYPCWMDVGHIGGGDNLYGRIYEGISRAKVILCCLTPRYVLSPICCREVNLADVLRKPIVPVMIEPTPWPPPGPIALILSPLVYIDLCDVGRHGGCGQQADWESNFKSIVQRISHFADCSFPVCNLTATPSFEVLTPETVFSPESENLVETVTDAEERASATDISRIDDRGDTPPNSSSGNQGNRSPVSWVQSQPNNRVLRCSVCTVI